MTKKEFVIILFIHIIYLSPDTPLKEQVLSPEATHSLTHKDVIGNVRTDEVADRVISNVISSPVYDIVNVLVDAEVDREFFTEAISIVEASVNAIVALKGLTELRKSQEDVVVS